MNVWISLIIFFIISQRSFTKTIDIYEDNCERNLDEIPKQDLCPRQGTAEHKMTPKSSYKSQAIETSVILRSTQTTKSRHQLQNLRNMPTIRASSSKPQNYRPFITYQTIAPVSLECPTACTCNLQISNPGLNVNCQEKKIKCISDLNPKPYKSKKMYLTGNYINSVYSSDFLDTTSLDLLHLGNNRISLIQSKAFAQLKSLRKLYLNGNLIERVSSYMFCGLESLQFLSLRYNIIREIETGTFEQVPNLKLLFLNNNFLKVLPAEVFSGMTLIRLNLRNNYLQNLPLFGVLEYLRSLVHIDLYENPWNCSCSIVEMKKWLQELSGLSIVHGIICESPLKLTGDDLRYIQSSYLCPNNSDVQVSTLPPSEESFPESTITLEMALDYNLLDNTIPLSVTILTLLLIIIVAVFIAAGLFTKFAKKQSKYYECKNFNVLFCYQSGINFQTSASHIYEYVPPPQIFQSPIYGTVEERLSVFELNTTLSLNSVEELGSSEFSTSNRPSPLTDDKFYFEDIFARPYQASNGSTLSCKHGTSLYSSDFDCASVLAVRKQTTNYGVRGTQQERLLVMKCQA